MSLFSFSMEGVNPECTVRFDFATKTMLTLSAPFALAVVVLLISFSYGVKGCFALKSLLRAHVRELSAHNLLKKALFRKRLRTKLASTSAKPGDEPSPQTASDAGLSSVFVEKLEVNHLGLEDAMSKLLLKEASFLSCLKAWLIVVFYKKVEFEPSSNAFWFALCPVLIARLKTRLERSAKENVSDA